MFNVHTPFSQAPHPHPNAYDVCESAWKLGEGAEHFVSPHSSALAWLCTVQSDNLKWWSNLHVLFCMGKYFEVLNLTECNDALMGWFIIQSCSHGCWLLEWWHCICAGGRVNTHAHILSRRPSLCACEIFYFFFVNYHWNNPVETKSCRSGLVRHTSLAPMTQPQWSAACETSSLEAVIWVESAWYYWHGNEGSKNKKWDSWNSDIL